MFSIGRLNVQLYAFIVKDNMYKNVHKCFGIKQINRKPTNFQPCQKIDFHYKSNYTIFLSFLLQNRIHRNVRVL